MNRIAKLGIATAALVSAAGCAMSSWKSPEDAPVKAVAQIDRMTGEELTVKREFVKDGYKLLYRLHEPAKCESGRRYPLVLFLHGAGERGNDNTKTLVHGVVPICKYAMKHGDAFVIAPQCPAGKKWVNQDWSVQSMRRPKAPTEEMVAVMALLDDICAKHPIDRTRISVTGISMGGFGTWDIVARKKGFFAAMMPICGGVDETTAEDYKDGIAIRFFHGSVDGAGNVGYSRRMDKALTDAGVVHGYTEYPGVNHDCWTRTYANDANLRWLFGCRR